MMKFKRAPEGFSLLAPPVPADGEPHRIFITSNRDGVRYYVDDVEVHHLLGFSLNGYWGGWRELMRHFMDCLLRRRPQSAAFSVQYWTKVRPDAVSDFAVFEGVAGKGAA